MKKILKKLFFVILLIIFSPLIMPFYIYDRSLSKRIRILKTLKRNGFIMRQEEKRSHSCGQYIYHKDNICIRIFNETDVKISFNFLDDNALFDEIYKLNVGNTASKEQLYFEKILYQNAHPVDIQRGDIHPYNDVALFFVINNMNAILNLNAPFFEEDESKFNKIKEEYNEKRMKNEKIIFEFRMAKAEVNLVDKLQHVILEHQRQDSVYMNLRPGKYSSKSFYEELCNSINFREEEFEIIEIFLLKVNIHYKNMGHFGVTHYDSNRIKEIIAYLEEFIDLYKTNDVYESLKLMGFDDILEQERIENHFNSEYESAFCDKERMLLMYQDTVTWLSRVLDAYGEMHVCGI